MGNLQIFESPEFGQVRTIEIDSKIMFVAKDVAKALGYSKPEDAVTRHCDDSMFHGVIDSIGRKQKVKIIPESDVYALIFRSKLPTAKKFKRWVFDEVLPSLRKTGEYKIKKELTRLEVIDMLRETELARIETENKLIESEQKLIEAEPKLDIYETFIEAKTNISIGELAKTLNKSHGCGGRNTLLRLLRELKLLMSSKANKNLPYQKYVDSGYFVVIEIPMNIGGVSVLKSQTLVTPRGAEYIKKKLYN